jgi:hypothetical protein
MKVRRIRWAYPSGNSGVLVGRFLGPCCPSESEGRPSLRFGWTGEPDDGKAVYIAVTEPTEVNGQVVEAGSWWAGDPRGVYDDVEIGRRMYAPSPDTRAMPKWAADWLREHKRWPKYAPPLPVATKAPEPRVIRARVNLHIDFDLESISSSLQADGDYYNDDGEEISLDQYALENVREALDDSWLSREATFCITDVEAFVEGAHSEEHDHAVTVASGDGVQWEAKE